MSVALTWVAHAGRRRSQSDNSKQGFEAVTANFPERDEPPAEEDVEAPAGDNDGDIPGPVVDEPAADEELEGE